MGQENLKGYKRVCSNIKMIILYSLIIILILALFRTKVLQTHTNNYSYKYVSFIMLSYFISINVSTRSLNIDI